MDIEQEIVAQISDDVIAASDIELHLPENVQLAIREFAQMLLYRLPYVWIAGSAVDHGLQHALGLLATDWQRLLAAILYTHFELRDMPRTV